MSLSFVPIAMPLFSTNKGLKKPPIDNGTIAVKGKRIVQFDKKLRRLIHQQQV
jgi:hypothetical protein